MIETVDAIYTILNYILGYFALGLMLYFLINVRNMRNPDTYVEHPKMSWSYFFFWPIVIFKKRK